MAAKMGQGIERIGDEADPAVGDPVRRQLREDARHIVVEAWSTYLWVGLFEGNPAAEQQAPILGEAGSRRRVFVCR